MPASAAAIAGTAISAGTSLYQTISANNRAKELQSQIDNYQRQNLTNPYEGLQVSTLGADRQREDLARNMAIMANQAAMGGSRAIVGLAPNMMALQSQQEAQIMANLDQQYNQNQQLVARGNEMVQNMVGQMENNDLIGLGTALNTARQEQINGMNNLVGTAISATNLATSGAFGDKKQNSGLGESAQSSNNNGTTVQGVSSTTPQNNLPMSFFTPFPFQPSPYISTKGNVVRTPKFMQEAFPKIK